MARKDKIGKGELDKLGSNFDDGFLSPLSERKLSGEPGPDVFNIPVATPEDPLGFVPGGTKGGSIKVKK